MKIIDKLSDCHPILAIITKASKAKRFLVERQIIESLKPIIESGIVNIKNNIIHGVNKQAYNIKTLGYGVEKEKVTDNFYFQHDGNDQNYHLFKETIKTRPSYLVYDSFQDSCEYIDNDHHRISHKTYSHRVDERIKGIQGYSRWISKNTSLYEGEVLMSYAVCCESINKEKNMETGMERYLVSTLPFDQMCDYYWRLEDNSMLHLTQAENRDGKKLELYEVGNPPLDSFKATYRRLTKDEWDQLLQGLLPENLDKAFYTKNLKKN